jgi:putative transposase
MVRYWKVFVESGTAGVRAAERRHSCSHRRQPVVVIATRLERRQARQTYNRAPLAFVHNRRNVSHGSHLHSTDHSRHFQHKRPHRLFVRDRRADVFSYMGGILRQLECDPLHINGVADHVHLVFRFPAKLSLADVIGQAKGNCAKWIHDKSVLPGRFAWQRGYAAFSVSESNVERVFQYVANQEVHHRRLSFQDELRAFLRQHRIEYDERYLWS